MSPPPTRRSSERRAAALALAAALAAACGRAGSNEPAAGAGAPTRIVALTVGSVDTLARLGELARVVGVEEDCFVPGTESLVKIRNDDHAGPSKALNVEAILALHPDAVIAKEDLRSALDGRGLNVLWVPGESGLDTVAVVVERIGRLVHAEARAAALLATMRSRMERIAARTAPLPQVRVYYEAGQPGRTVGAKTVTSAMIRLAGGASIADALPLANPWLSSEAIVAADPEVILLSPWSDPPEVVAARPGWSAIAAVKSGRVFQIPERLRSVGYPSPGCVDGCDSMFVPWLHPELAAAERER